MDKQDTILRMAKALNEKDPKTANNIYREIKTWANSQEMDTVEAQAAYSEILNHALYIVRTGGMVFTQEWIEENADEVVQL